MLIVRLLLELELAAVVQQLSELLRVPGGQVLDRCDRLLDLDLLILFLLGLCGQPLPRQVPSDEVHEDYADLFKVISAGLLYPQMGVETCISRRPRQTLVILEGDVTAALRIFVPLSQTKVDNVNNVLILPGSDQEIVRFDISVKKSILMHELNTLELK